MNHPDFPGGSVSWKWATTPAPYRHLIWIAPRRWSTSTSVAVSSTQNRSSSICRGPSKFRCKNHLPQAVLPALATSRPDVALQEQHLTIGILDALEAPFQALGRPMDLLEGRIG